MVNKRKQKKTTTPNGGEIIIYQGRGKAPRLEVRLENESVWLTQKQMADLFGKNRKTITEHIQNVFKEHELEVDSVCRKFQHTAPDGKKYDVNFYNLDIIISVGYRVKSLRGTQFRIWATRVLRDHILKGYTINRDRLLEQSKRLEELQQAIAFIKGKVHHPEVAGQTEELLSVIHDYAHSLTLLYQYDQGALEVSRKKKAHWKLTYDQARVLIDQIKHELVQKKEAGHLFGQEYGEKFNGILGSLYQTFDRKELYATVEEKAANLLYLTIKDHPFADGNKRIGSLMFVYFLERNNYLYRNKGGEAKITDTTIVALALLIATSDPKEKDMMIKLVTNLLV